MDKRVPRDCSSGHQSGLGGARGRGRQGFPCLTTLGLSGLGGDRVGQQGRALGTVQVTDRAQCLMRAGHCPCLPFLKSQSSEVLPDTRGPSTRRKEAAGASFMPQGHRGPLKNMPAGSLLLRLLLPTRPGLAWELDRSGAHCLGVVLYQLLWLL